MTWTTRREESDGSDGVDVFDDENGFVPETDFDYLLAEEEPQGHEGFDAFDENTWDEVFTPCAGNDPGMGPAGAGPTDRQPAPHWRRSSFRWSCWFSGSPRRGLHEPDTGHQRHWRQPRRRRRRRRQARARRHASTTTATTAPEPSTMERAPAVVRPTVRPRPTKEPEIGVTRTPATRMPISVAPQPAPTQELTLRLAVMPAVVKQQDVSIERVIERVLHVVVGVDLHVAG